MGEPGLTLVAPATPADAKGLLKSAIRDDNPVVVFEHKLLYGRKGEVADGDEALVPLARAALRRSGADVTIVGAMRAVEVALDAAEKLAAEGIDAAVIDLRTLRPLDTSTVVESVSRSGRLVVVEEGPPTGGYARRGHRGRRSSSQARWLRDASRCPTCRSRSPPPLRMRRCLLRKPSSQPSPHYRLSPRAVRGFESVVRSRQS